MVHIAQATEHDFPEVRRLFLEYLQWLIPMLATHWAFSVPFAAEEAVDYLMADLQKYLPPDGRLLLARDHSGVVGCACAWTIRPGLAELKRVYVRPAGRGSGTGRALVESMIADLRGAGYTAVRLDTASFMTAAEHLYRSLGFRDIVPYEDSETPKDMRQHAVFLELSL